MNNWFHDENTLVNLDRIAVANKEKDLSLRIILVNGETFVFDFSSTESRDEYFQQVIKFSGAQDAVSTGKQSVCY